MPDWIVPALLALNLLVLLWLAWHRPDDSALREAFEQAQARQAQGSERQERELRSEVQSSARDTRAELAQALSLFQQAVLAQSGDAVRTQNEQIDTFRTQLTALQQQVAQALQASTVAQGRQAQVLGESLGSGLATAREAQDNALKRLADSLTQQLQALTEANERRLGEVRQAVEAKLTTLQDGNEKKLEQMRATVDEKLHATLEQRLGESFRQVADRLEQVHKGLGDMQALARDVGSLNRVLTNVKSRGVFGEVQLAGLLEQVFTPEQYATNVETVPGSNARVEFAIRLPGRRDDGQPLWLPIDAKFPREDYERLLNAQEAADPVAAEAAGRGIEVQLRKEAKAIRDKYIAAPYTTDFGILFVPIEGLYAEALRRPGLVEAMQRDHRITLAGPTTLLATLTSLQMGFRTLALEKRSAEVWEVLSAVKTEFGKFGEVLARTKKKLDEASRTIDDAETRTRAMARKLKGVETLPEERLDALLSPATAGDDGDAEAAG